MFGFVASPLSASRSELYFFPSPIEIPSDLQVLSLRAISYDLVASRSRIQRDVLAKITCPLLLVYAGADCAYPFPLVEEVQRDLVDAGLEVELKTVEEASQ